MPPPLENELEKKLSDRYARLFELSPTILLQKAKPKKKQD
jgi:hypothetical protein